MDFSHLPSEFAGVMQSLFSSEVSILEESIDINTQFEYYEYVSRTNRQTVKSKKQALKVKDAIFNLEVSDEIKKDLLVRLAAINQVDVFRTIERFANEDKSNLRNWGVLALQESRMLIEGALLNQHKIHISTGLGGKRDKLRYFVVLVTNNNITLNDLQKKIIKSEFNFNLSNLKSEVEEINYNKTFATLKVLIPLKEDFRNILDQAIAACNVFGNFLSIEYFSTNVRILTNDEIISAIRRGNKQ